MSAIGSERDKPEFIQDNQILFVGEGNEPVEAILFLSRQQFVHQTGGCPKMHSRPCRQAARASEMDK